MEALRIALGLIKDKGKDEILPRLVGFGDEESDFLVGHVKKVREQRANRSRSTFTDDSAVPLLLKRLLNASDKEFNEISASLQEKLAAAMRGSTNAKDCVFAVVVTGMNGTSEHVTLLKLDAIVEAAQTSITEGRISLHVLKKLVPEPGKLQKALSWPDEIQSSDVIMIDTNASQAKYFENSYDVRVSPKSSAAESELESFLADHLPEEKVGPALSDAFDMSGPMDKVVVAMARKYPELEESARGLVGSSRPAGIIRKNKIGTRLVWYADGAELRVPRDQQDKVSVSEDRNGDGWVLEFRSRTRPTQHP